MIVPVGRGVKVHEVDRLVLHVAAKDVEVVAVVKGIGGRHAARLSTRPWNRKDRTGEGLRRAAPPPGTATFLVPAAADASPLA